MLLFIVMILSSLTPRSYYLFLFQFGQWIVLTFAWFWWSDMISESSFSNLYYFCPIPAVICVHMNLCCSREFTHRVKSVSMSKFTSQEVEALQNGGNQVWTSVTFVFIYGKSGMLLKCWWDVLFFALFSVQEIYILRIGTCRGKDCLIAGAEYVIYLLSARHLLVRFGVF